MQERRALSAKQTRLSRVPHWGRVFGEISDKATFFPFNPLVISVAQRLWSCSSQSRQSAEIVSLHVRKWEKLEMKKIQMIDFKCCYCGAAYPGIETLYGRRR
jgi:hypothetical protein